MLEKRLSRNPELQAQYVEFHRECEVLENSHEVCEAEDPPNVAIRPVSERSATGRFRSTERLAFYRPAVPEAQDCLFRVSIENVS